MGRMIRTARGELVDFDAIKIKQQLAAAPVAIEVARRQAFIDSKEGKKAVVRPAPPPVPDVVEVAPDVATVEARRNEDFIDVGQVAKGAPVEAVPNLPVRERKAK